MVLVNCANSNPCPEFASTQMNFRTKNATDHPNALFSRALANMEPLFSLYGWAEDEGGLVDEAISSGASEITTACTTVHTIHLLEKLASIYADMFANSLLMASRI